MYLFMCSFCTKLMESSPPATSTGTLSTMTRCAAMAIVCRPGEQKRLTVTPLVVTGKAARSAICRAVVAGRALGVGATHDHVFHFGGVAPCPLDSVLHHVPAHRCPMGHVESAAIGFAYGRAGGGNNYGIGHFGSPENINLQSVRKGELTPPRTGQNIRPPGGARLSGATLPIRDLIPPAILS